MSISQSPPLYSVPVDPSTWNLGSRPLPQTLHARRQNKKRRLEAKYGRKQKDNEDETEGAPYTPFFVAEEILLNNSGSSSSSSSSGQNNIHTQSQSQSLLLSILPTELLLLIVEHLSIPYFQVSLALTCKRIATILSQNRIRISPWRGYLDKEGLYRLLTQPERPFSNNPHYPAGRPKTKQRHLSLDNLSITDPSSSSSTATTLTRSQTVPFPKSLPGTTYIPSTLRLCRACFRHVPRDPIYWQSKMRSPAYDSPNVNWFDITNFFEEGYRNCGQHKCPDCCVKGYLAFMSEGSYERAVREDRRDEEWGIELDGERVERGRRVCPGLVGRLGRP